MVRIPPRILVPIVNVYCKRRLECLSASGNHISPKHSLEKVPTRDLLRKDLEGPWVTGQLLSSSTRNMRRNGRGRRNISRNRTRQFLEWSSAQVHVVSLRISIRYVPRHPINTIYLAAIVLSVIVIPPYLVTVSETK